MQNCNISLFAPDLTEVKSLQYLFNISTKCFSSNTRQQSALFFSPIIMHKKVCIFMI